MAMAVCWHVNATNGVTVNGASNRDRDPKFNGSHFGLPWPTVFIHAQECYISHNSFFLWLLF